MRPPGDHRHIVSGAGQRPSVITACATRPYDGDGNLAIAQLRIFRCLRLGGLEDIQVPGITRLRISHHHPVGNRLPRFVPTTRKASLVTEINVSLNLIQNPHSARPFAVT